MSEVVERVARASFAFWKQQNSRVADFEDMNPDELEFAMAHARAMIGEMRKPTPSMVRAVYSVEPELDCVRGHHLMEDEVPKIFTAMIDEASK